MPRHSSRRLTVDGTHYRWMISQRGGRRRLLIEREDDPFGVAWEDVGHRTITPVLTRQMLCYAVQLGWSEPPGKPNLEIPAATSPGTTQGRAEYQWRWLFDDARQDFERGFGQHLETGSQWWGAYDRSFSAKVRWAGPTAGIDADHWEGILNVDGQGARMTAFAFRNNQRVHVFGDSHYEFIQNEPGDWQVRTWMAYPGEWSSIEAPGDLFTQCAVKLRGTRGRVRLQIFSDGPKQYIFWLSRWRRRGETAWSSGSPHHRSPMTHPEHDGARWILATFDLQESRVLRTLSPGEYEAQVTVAAIGEETRCAHVTSPFWFECPG